VKTAGMPGDHQFDLKIHYKTVSKVLKQDLTPYQGKQGDGSLVCDNK